MRKPIYEVWERAGNNSYHRTLGALEYVASSESRVPEEVKRFASRLLADMLANYEKEMARLRKRYDIDECKVPDEEVEGGEVHSLRT